MCAVLGQPGGYVAMSTSFVGLDCKGFWMEDSILELWLRLLALHIEQLSDEKPVAGKIRDKWLMASTGYFGGIVPTDLEDAVSSSDGRTIVLLAIASLEIALEEGPPVLDHGTLNILGFHGRKFTSDIESSRLMEVAGAFRDLINGRIESDDESTEFMPGSNIET
jgi:hypothetical protein